MTRNSDGRDRAFQLSSTAAEMSVHPIFVVDRSGVFLFVNPVAASEMGKQPASLIGRKMEDFFHPGMISQYLAAVERVVDSGIAETVEAGVPLGRQRGRCRTFVHPMISEGSSPPSALLIQLHQDEFILAGEDLHSDRNLCSLILKTANSLILCLDQRARITVFNDECERVTGYKREEVIDRNWPEIFLPPDFRHDGLKNFAEWVMQHPYDRYEGPLVTKSGEIRTIFWSNSSLINPESGEIVAIAIGNDVTETKRARGLLIEAESKYRSLVENLPAITYIAALDEASTTLYVSPQVESILGLTQDDYATNPDIWRQRLHPHDRDRVLNELASSRVKGESFSSEYRMLARDDRVIWFSDQAIFVRDDNGTPLMLQGVMFDISARKLAEKALQESEAKFRTLAESVGVAICIVQGNNMRYANSTLESALGYSRSELMAMNFWDICHPEYRELLRKRGQMRLQGLEVPSSYEVKFLTKGGEEVWVGLSVALTDYEGKPAILATGFNITERMKMEAELQSVNELLHEERRALLEKNIALRQVLDHIKDEVDQVKSQIRNNLERQVLPTLLKLKEKVSDNQKVYIDLLESLLRDLTSPFTSELDSRFMNLTPRELEICNMIKNGLQTKEVARVLSISNRTVEKFRQRIRQKLGLSKSDNKLVTFLRSLPQRHTT